jgi:RHS repeat-associated protein
MSDGNRIWRANSDRFHYDEHNQISGRAGDWGEHVFVHDALGRLKKVYYQNVRGSIKLRWEADYDALGRRTHRRRYRKGGKQEAWEFFWDGDRLGAETLPDGSLRIYLYADAKALVPMIALEYASVQASPDAARVYVLQSDHRGAIERVEDESGAIVWEAVVQPYGEAEITIGEDFHQPFRLVGQYADPGLNLSCNRFRYWSPELGRFIESDPLGLAGGLNLYAWPGCPLLTSDPLGLGCGGDDRDAPTVREEGADAEAAPVLDGGAWSPPKTAESKIPADWGPGVPNKKKVGTRWQRPGSKGGDSVRIDQGDPSSAFPSQRVDHVRINSGGKVIGPDGKPIAGVPSPKDTAEAHIPLSEWIKWRNWDSP